MGNVLMILKNITVLIFMQEIMVPFSKSLLKPVDHTAHNAQNKAFYIVYEVCKQRHKLLQKLLNRRCISSEKWKLLRYCIWCLCWYLWIWSELSILTLSVPVIAVSAFLCDVMFILHLVKDAVTTLNFSDFRHASPFSGITMVNQQYILR